MKTNTNMPNTPSFAPLTFYSYILDHCPFLGYSLLAFESLPQTDSFLAAFMRQMPPAPLPCEDAESDFCAIYF